MDINDFDANNSLEILVGGEGFTVWLFDYQIGEGATVEAAIADAKKNARRWTEVSE